MVRVWPEGAAGGYKLRSVREMASNVQAMGNLRRVSRVTGGSLLPACVGCPADRTLKFCSQTAPIYNNNHNQSCNINVKSLLSKTNKNK